MAAFLAAAKAEIDGAADRWAAAQLERILELLVSASGVLARDIAGAVSYPFLQLASLATTGWIALRLSQAGDDAVEANLAALGRHWLRMALPLAQAEAERVALGHTLIAEFTAIDASVFA